ncbi:hypothetical protein QFC21_002148, partial [Naganishia friedmannii]
MTILALPDEVIDIITGHLNAPQDAFGYHHFRFASTACLSKLDKIYAKDNEMYLMWSEWRRDSLALSSVCKRLRKAVFDRFWLQAVTMEWTSKKLQASHALLDASARAKVETLTLRGDCNATSTSRAALKDYVELFPHLRKIDVILVYPDVPHWEKPDKVDRADHARNKTSKALSTLVSAKSPIANSSLQSINLAIHKSNAFKGETHKYEVKGFIQDFQTDNQVKQLKMKKLDHYHLELTFSRSKRTAGDALFWRTFSNRMKEACVIPTKEAWPKEVESISLRIALEDFAMARHKNLLNMIGIGKDGSVGLVDGYLPSEKSMNGFLKQLRKTRPSLQKFDLIIYCCQIPLTSATSRQISQYTYTIASPETSRNISSTGVYKVNQLALDNLHQFYLEQEEAFGTLGSDEEADFEEETEMMIEMEEEAA